MTFDHIIVGGGSAGAVLANRLSADPTRRVVLLDGATLTSQLRSACAGTASTTIDAPVNAFAASVVAWSFTGKSSG